MTCARLTLLAALSSTLFIGSLGLAQIDPRAEVLLNSLEDGFALQPDTFETFDTTLCITSYEAGEAQHEACIRMVMDVIDRRMYSETRSEFDGEQYVMEMVYQNGRATMRDDFSFSDEDDELFELPKEDVAAIEANFKAMFDQLSEVANAIPEDYQSASYDGEVSYGGVLAGEQVTMTILMPTFTAEGPSPRETTMRLVFDAQGQHIGSVIDSSQVAGLEESMGPEGELLVVYTNPVPYIRVVNTTNYQLEGDNATPLYETRVTRYLVNEPLDETLFELETAPRNAP